MPWVPGPGGIPILQEANLHPSQVEIQVPGALQEDLEANRRLILPFVSRVAMAVQRSMNDPRTRPRLVGTHVSNTVKERMRMAWGICVVLRRDYGYTLHQIMDEIGDVLIQAILHGQKGEDVALKETQKGRWADPDEKGPVLRAVDREVLSEVRDEGDEATEEALERVEEQVEEDPEEG